MRAVARITGKQHSYLSLVESDSISPSVDSLRELCPAYGVEVWEVASGLTRAEFVHQVLGPVPLDDPAVKEILQIAALPDGLSNIRSLLEIVKDRPQELQGVLRMVKLMRESGMLKDQ